MKRKNRNQNTKPLPSSQNTKPLPAQRKIELVYPPQVEAKPDILDKLEQISKIVGIIAIPIVIAFGGKLLDQSSKEREQKSETIKLELEKSYKERESRREYLKIAVDILNNPAPTSSGDADLRAWAVQVLGMYSPVPIPSTVVPKISNGVSHISPLYDPNGNMIYTYDPNGRMIGQSTKEGKMVSYAYDSLNRITSVTYADGNTTEYSYKKASDSKKQDVNRQQDKDFEKK